MKKNFLYYLPTIIFNLAETLVIIYIGVLLKLNIRDALLVLVTFGIVRMTSKNALHFKHWYRCIIWSTLFFASMFTVLKIDLELSVALTVFEAIILSGKGNISDIFQWKNVNKINQEIYDWVKFNYDNPGLLRYEKALEETDKRKYYIFEYRFREFKTYNEIAELMDIPTQRVADELKIISHFIEYSIRLAKKDN